MSDSAPLAVHDFSEGGLPAALEFFKRTRSELRMLRKVRVWSDRVQLFDVNGDWFELRGIGYPDADIVPILKNVNTNFKPERIHESFEGPFKEFLTGRRYPWAQDRVM